MRIYQIVLFSTGWWDKNFWTRSCTNKMDNMFDKVFVSFEKVRLTSNTHPRECELNVHCHGVTLWIYKYTHSRGLGRFFHAYWRILPNRRDAKTPATFSSLDLYDYGIRLEYWQLERPEERGESMRWTPFRRSSAERGRRIRGAANRRISW